MSEDAQNTPMPAVAAKPKLGRPPKPAAERLDDLLQVALSADIRKALRRFSDKHLVGSEGAAVRKILIERLRKEGYLEG